MISSAHVAAVSYSNCEGAALIHAHRSYNTGSMWAQPATYRKKKKIQVNLHESCMNVTFIDQRSVAVSHFVPGCSKILESFARCVPSGWGKSQTTSWLLVQFAFRNTGKRSALSTNQISSQISNTCVCLCKISEITGLVLLIIAQRVCTAKQTQHVMMQYLLRIAHFKEPCSSILEMTLGE